MYRVRVGLLVLIMPSLVFAATHDQQTLASIESRLGTYPVIIARMSISQNISILSRPVVSSGHIVVDRRLGVIWQIDAPFASTTMFPVSASAGASSAEPGARIVSKLISTIVGGQFNDLTAYFSVDAVAMSPDGDFSVTLKPVNSGLARMFSRLVLRGSRELKLVELVSANGDTTRYEFSDYQHPATGKASLSEYLPMLR